MRDFWRPSIWTPLVYGPAMDEIWESAFDSWQTQVIYLLWKVSRPPVGTHLAAFQQLGLPENIFQ